VGVAQEDEPRVERVKFLDVDDPFVRALLDKRRWVDRVAGALRVEFKEELESRKALGLQLASAEPCGS